jgi:hypothetical protein
MRRPPPPPLRHDRAGKPFWRDADGFTSRDFKVVLTGLTWLAATGWMVWLLMAREAGEFHLRFYSNVSQVFMVLLGGMAINQFGGQYFGGGGGYGGGYGGYGSYPQSYPQEYAPQNYTDSQEGQ